MIIILIVSICRMSRTRNEVPLQVGKSRNNPLFDVGTTLVRADYYSASPSIKSEEDVLYEVPFDDDIDGDFHVYDTPDDNVDPMYDFPLHVSTKSRNGSEVRYDDPRNEVRYDDPRKQVMYDDPRNEVRYDDPRQEMAYDDPRNDSGSDIDV
jgi:hypothetical protein